MVSPLLAVGCAMCASLVFFFLSAIVAYGGVWRNGETPHDGRDACAPPVSVRGIWRAGRDSNSHLTDLESGILPIETTDLVCASPDVRPDGARVL